MELTRRRVLIAGGAGLVGAGGTATLLLRRRRRRDPFAGLQTVRTDGAAGPRGSLVVVGDSLTFERLADLVTRLRAAGFGPVRVDGRPGRRCVTEVSMATSGLQAVAAAQAVGEPRRWLISLGTNDVVFDPGDDAVDRVAQVLRAVGPAPVAWVNLHLTGDLATRVPPFNAAIAQACASQPGATVVDWAAEAAAHPEWFVGDGIHNTPDGALARNAFLVDRLVALDDAG